MFPKKKKGENQKQINPYVLNLAWVLPCERKCPGKDFMFLVQLLAPFQVYQLERKKANQKKGRAYVFSERGSPLAFSYSLFDTG